MSTPENTRKQFLLRMPTEEHTALTAYAAETGQSMNDAIRSLLRQQLTADHVVRVPMNARDYARLRELAALRGMTPEGAFLDMFRAIAALPDGHHYVAMPVHPNKGENT